MIINLTPSPCVLDGKIWIWGYANAELFNMKAFDPRRTTLIVPVEKYKMMSNPKWEFKRVLTNNTNRPTVTAGSKS